VGALIVLGLETLIGSTFAAFGQDVGSFGLFLFTTTAAFLIGGGVIGWMSPGYTPWEAGFAGLLAAFGTVGLAVRLLHFGDGFYVTVPVALAVGLLCGLAGGRIGERIQTRSGSRG
jgi:hypothetical protein